MAGSLIDRVQWFDLDACRPTQPEFKLRADHVERLRRALINGWKLDRVPPILGTIIDRHVSINDGHHRCAAARAAGLTIVPVLNRRLVEEAEAKAEYLQMLDALKAILV